jgi:hypothetical protein
VPERAARLRTAPWRRTFTAFACFPPDPIVIDEATPEQLMQPMRCAELRYAVPAVSW